MEYCGLLQNTSTRLNDGFLDVDDDFVHITVIITKNYTASGTDAGYTKSCFAKCW